MPTDSIKSAKRGQTLFWRWVYQSMGHILTDHWLLEWWWCFPECVHLWSEISVFLWGKSLHFKQFSCLKSTSITMTACFLRVAEARVPGGKTHASTSWRLPYFEMRDRKSYVTLHPTWQRLFRAEQLDLWGDRQEKLVKMANHTDPEWRGTAPRKTQPVASPRH